MSRVLLVLPLLLLLAALQVADAPADGCTGESRAGTVEVESCAPRPTAAGPVGGGAPCKFLTTGILRGPPYVFVQVRPECLPPPLVPSDLPAPILAQGTAASSVPGGRAPAAAAEFPAVADAPALLASTP